MPSGWLKSALYETSADALNELHMNLTILLVAAVAVVWAMAASRAVKVSLASPDRFPVVHWQWPEGLFTTCIVLFFLSTGAAAFGKEPQRISLESLETSVALYAAVTLFVIGFLVMRNVPLVEAFGLGAERAKTVFGPVLIGVLVAVPAIYAVQWVVYTFLADADAPQPIVTFLLEHDGLRDRLAVAAIALIAAPLTEELVFRGCLYGVLRQLGGRWLAIAVTAVVFALIHGHAASIPGLLILAVALALLYEATGSLWAPLALHAVFNGLSLLGTILWPEAMQ